jgi:hypothetical protein
MRWKRILKRRDAICEIAHAHGSLNEMAVQLPAEDQSSLIKKI